MTMKMSDRMSVGDEYIITGVYLHPEKNGVGPRFVCTFEILLFCLVIINCNINMKYLQNRQLRAVNHNLF